MSRSASGSPASRSATVSCRFQTPTRGRSARARRANRPSSGPCTRSPRSPRTPAGARAGSCWRRRRPGNPGEEKLLPATVAELQTLGLKPTEVAVDGGFPVRLTQQTLEPIAPERLFIAGKRSTAAGASKRTRDRLASYRTGSEGRISHLKRGYGLKRSRLKGAAGTKTWVGWGALAYNLDTYALYAIRDA